MDKVTNVVSNSPYQTHVSCQVSPSHSSVALPSSPGHPGTSTLIDGHLELENHARQSRVTIDILPDVALLEIFDIYARNAWVETWQTLVHVCRKWRSTVFGSPRRLNLRLYCSSRTQVRETLDVWPRLPILIVVHSHEMWGGRGGDNIIAALEQNDRICELGLFEIPSSQLENVSAALERPFPTLTRLELQPKDETASVVPDSFLGGSAPLLRKLFLCRIPFPGLPKLLLSATRLVSLRLDCIPHSGYISPEVMVFCLSVLTRLETLVIKFESPRSRSSRRPPPQTRTLLPVLTQLRFFGVSKYFEDLVARIDAPRLNRLSINFFYQLIFDTPQLAQFISRTPNFRAYYDGVHVVFYHLGVRAILPQIFVGDLELAISCGRPDLQLSSLAQVCSWSFPQALIPAVEELYILEDRRSRPQWRDNIENTQWLELLHQFTAVKDLYISREFASRIAPTLQELVGERVTEVLPALRSIFLEETLPPGPGQEAIGRFVAARQLSSHPIVLSRWEREMDDGSEYDD